MTEGRSGVKALWRKLAIWRGGVKWYLVALGLPVVVGLAAVALAAALGSTTATQIGAFAPFSLLMFVFAAGEEVGWRGYALPRLLVGRSALSAGLIMGALWFAFHVPLFLPGQFFASDPLVPTLIVFLAQSVLYTWLYQHTRGSVLMATLFHGATNASGFLYAGMGQVQFRELTALLWGAAAIAIVLIAGPNLTRKPVAPAEEALTHPVSA
jgi:membrane protease YdiL (CAAX protease family)